MGRTQTDTLPFNTTNSSDSTDGQYMVEFALSLSVFIFFMLLVMDLGLLIYNHNLFYNAVYRGARQASLGATNDEVRNTVTSYIEDSYFPTLTMISHPDGGVQIRPDQEIDRVQGTSVRVSMDTTFGISMFAMYPLTISVPIRSEELITIRNDDDRDGLKDQLEANPRDHDNDGSDDSYQFDGPDLDADGDGANDQSDTVVIGYFENVNVNLPVSCPISVTCLSGFYSGYAIVRPNNPLSTVTACSAFSWNGLTWQSNPCFDGDYHAREVWDNSGEAPLSFFSKDLPTYHVDNGSDLVYTRTLSAVRDSDNDGWIDKYDDSPNDVTDH